MCLFLKTVKIKTGGMRLKHLQVRLVWQRQADLVWALMAAEPC